MAEPREFTLPRDALVSMKTVQALVGDLSTAVIYELMAEGRFPNSVQLTKKRVAWRVGDVLDWCTTRPSSPAKRMPAGRRRA